MKATPFLTLLISVWLTIAGQTQAQSLKSQLEEIVRSSGFKGSVLVSHADRTLLAVGYGLADHEKGIKNSASTQHRIGSVTKQFTAMAMLILEEQGKLKTQAKVGDYLKGVPKTWQALTLHQLLTHTSGLTHSWAVPAFARNGSKPKTLDETLALFFELPLKFEPGTDYQYSGVGYFLLAKIIESQSGQSYDAFLRQHIFEPLGMNNTGCDHPDRPQGEASRGYQINPRGNRRSAPGFYMPLLTGGGNLYSTVEDMQRWDKALREQKLISKESYDRMYTTERSNYAYGWKVRTQKGERWISHGGGVPGHSSFILRNPDKDLCVVIMSNNRAKRGRPIPFRLANAVLDQTN